MTVLSVATEDNSKRIMLREQNQGPMATATPGSPGPDQGFNAPQTRDSRVALTAVALFYLLCNSLAG